MRGFYEFMMKIAYFFLLCFGSTLMHAQVQRQMQSTQGRVYATSQGVVVSQSVGQQSVIGGHSSNGFIQGFQQKSRALLIDSNTETFQPTYIQSLIWDYPLCGTEINNPLLWLFIIYLVLKLTLPPLLWWCFNTWQYQKFIGII